MSGKLSSGGSSDNLLMALDFDCHYYSQCQKKRERLFLWTVTKILAGTLIGQAWIMCPYLNNHCCVKIISVSRRWNVLVGLVPGTIFVGWGRAYWARSNCWDEWYKFYSNHCGMGSPLERVFLSSKKGQRILVM